ncbi:MAG TPA: protein-disulfide reductase DsbD family protein, partial [Candidatus Berkiella sp.]|nr:protein-disulfide reductase DsbD family protein [Candidatus Berkiella sp.]
MLDKRKYNFIIIVLMLFVCAPKIEAQINQSSSSLPFSKVLSNEQAFMLSTSFEQSAIKFQWQIASGCYLYQERLHISLIEKDLTKLSLMPKAILPPAEQVEDPYFGPESIYKN